jgi:hypothetical protein
VRSGTDQAISRKPRRDRRLKVRVCPEEAQTIQDNARAVGMPVTAYLRAVGMGYRPRATVDRDRIAEMLRINGDLGRLGGLLKLFLSDDAKLRQFDSGQVSKVIVLTLRRIEETQSELRTVVKRALRKDSEP